MNEFNDNGYDVNGVQPDPVPETPVYTAPETPVYTAPQTPVYTSPYPAQEQAPVAPQPEPVPYGSVPQYGNPSYQQPQQAPPVYQAPQQNYQPRYDVPPVGYQQKSRLAAGVLGIFLGSLGIHNFYMGFKTRAIIQLVVTLAGGLLTCGVAAAAMEIWGFIEGVLILSAPAGNSRLYDGSGVIMKD